ncbi:hypothetical protein THASP1DRAFT_25781 [Thamnocephalis sphaerospora]|uniref:Uncharacterized protein n=1 Tax=Thamnocephalis sphaerospora TaxID=78915 RepID=A0A4P9XKJ5_9FUNG|nr:hypothetical protein THASP1DRAFT_25781 [Thamnocephalis sphaerospora]|eukprot:RKP05780.1 hypothetical protein THASP1DRAFT_25781 [Thamnocephalis sphaerospora]
MSVYVEEDCQAVFPSFGHDWAQRRSELETSGVMIDMPLAYSHSKAQSGRQTEMEDGGKLYKPFETGIPSGVSLPSSSSSKHLVKAADGDGDGDGGGTGEAAPPPPTSSEFPPLPTQDGSTASVPELPVANESYAQAAKHGKDSESESNAGSDHGDNGRAKHRRKRSRGNILPKDNRVGAAKTWFGVGLLAAVVGRMVEARHNTCCNGQYLFMGGLVTAVISGASWLWLRQRGRGHINNGS